MNSTNFQDEQGGIVEHQRNLTLLDRHPHSNINFFSAKKCLLIQ